MNKKANKKKKKKQINKLDLILKVISILFTIACLISFSFLGYYVFKVNIIPNKYIIIGSITSILLIGCLSFVLYTKSKNIFKVIAIVLMVLSSVFACIGASYLKNTLTFISGTNQDIGSLTYSVVVLKNSDYEKINDLNSKNIAYLSDNYQSDVKSKLQEVISFEEKLVPEVSEITDELLNKTVDAVVLEESYLRLAKEEIDDFDNQIKEIYTFNIKVDSYKEKNERLDVTNNSFILYISGIDQYGSVNNVRGRSDVNQIAVVNPRTHHILLINTPRDYYVQLDGTVGLKDKLTHAGIYGIDKSIKTLENFYDIDIDHYLRVNFDTLIKVVDVIGGIDIESDTEFIAHTNRNVHVKKGMNHFNGEQALAYSRERYAYASGDNHRGENQQQVISTIIEKLTSSKVLLNKYNSILNALDGSFATDMTTDMITSFIKKELDEEATWYADGISVKGTGSSNYTYSMGSKYKLYVMEPDMNSVNAAKEKIKEVFDEE